MPALSRSSSVPAIGSHEPGLYKRFALPDPKGSSSSGGSSSGASAGGRSGGGTSGGNRGTGGGGGGRAPVGTTTRGGGFKDAFSTQLPGTKVASSTLAGGKVHGGKPKKKKEDGPEGEEDLLEGIYYNDEDSKDELCPVLGHMQKIWADETCTIDGVNCGPKPDELYNIINGLRTAKTADEHASYMRSLVDQLERAKYAVSGGTDLLSDEQRKYLGQWEGYLKTDGGQSAYQIDWAKSCTKKNPQRADRGFDDTLLSQSNDRGQSICNAMVFEDGSNFEPMRNSIANAAFPPPGNTAPMDLTSLYSLVDSLKGKDGMDAAWVNTMRGTIDDLASKDPRTALDAHLTMNAAS